MEGEGDGAYVFVQGGYFWRVLWIGDLEKTEVEYGDTPWIWEPEVEEEHGKE